MPRLRKPAPVAAQTASTLPPKAQKGSDAALTQSDAAPARPAPRPTGRSPQAVTSSRTGPQVKSWSYSRYRDYVQCPFMFKCKHLDKLKEAPSEAMERGIRIGGEMESFFKDPKLPVPADCTALSETYLEIRRQKPLVEQMWGLDKDWNPVAWNDWNACWLRVKMDIVYMEKNIRRVHPLDNKTGKFKEKDVEVYLEQLDIYVAAAPAYFQGAKDYAPALLYSDLGMRYPDLDDQGEPTLIYTQQDAMSARLRWNYNVRGLFGETSWKPKPGNHCRWCSFSKSKGGPCEY